MPLNLTKSKACLFADLSIGLTDSGKEYTVASLIMWEVWGICRAIGVYRIDLFGAKDGPMALGTTEDWSADFVVMAMHHDTTNTCGLYLRIV